MGKKFTKIWRESPENSFVCTYTLWRSAVRRQSHAHIFKYTCTYVHVQWDIRAAKDMEITESQKQRPSCPHGEPANDISVAEHFDIWNLGGEMESQPLFVLVPDKAKGKVASELQKTNRNANLHSNWYWYWKYAAHAQNSPFDGKLPFPLLVFTSWPSEEPQAC